MGKKRCENTNSVSFSSNLNRNYVNFRSSKSQVTIFIVIGLMLILLIMLFLFTTNILAPENALFYKNNLENNFDSQSLNSFVDYCFSNSSNRLVKELSSNGGTLNKTDVDLHSRRYEGNNFRYLCVYQEGTEYCANRILTLSEMEQQLKYSIKNDMEKCLNFSFMNQKGYTIEEGDMEVEVDISNSNINYVLHYPLKIYRGNVILQEDYFRYSEDSDLGLVHKLVTDIINEETTNGYFNKDKWMSANNLLFKITKNRVYPDVIYQIISNNKIQNKKDDDIVFRFALNKEDKASEISTNVYNENYGCCYINSEGSCYKNADVSLCEKKNGSYILSPKCECNSHFSLNFNTNSIVEDNNKSCGDYKNGESWCSKISGVGGRAIKYSCHNGEIFEEPCEDFWGEVCVEYYQNNKINSECKINRWEDCAKCNTEECCENGEFRDCLWIQNNLDNSNILDTSKNIRCIPKQKPGFKFWEGSGQEICNYASYYSKCEGISCGQNWVDNSAKVCSNIGDCGINYNYLGDLTKSGYFETNSKNPKMSNDIIEHIQNYEIMKDKKIELSEKDSKKISDRIFNLERKRSTLFNVAKEESINLISTLLSTGLNFLDEAVSNQKLILDYSFCGLWQAPINGDCSKCGEFGIPCSQYSCYSLGDNCFYEEVDGFGECKQKKIDDEEIKIGLKTDFNYYIDSVQVADKKIYGYRITDVLPPFNLLDFEINTSKKTKCKITYLPDLMYAETPAIWFGDSMFSYDHKVSLRLPKEIHVPRKLYDKLGIDTLEQLFNLIIKNDDKLKEIFDDEFSYLLDEIYEFVDSKDYLFQLLNLTISGIDRNEYYTFIRCADDSGNENTDPVFLWFKINDTYVDNTPPNLVGTNPKNNSVVTLPYDLEIYLDEPSECKLDSLDLLYGAMNYNLNCDISQREMSGYNGGSYICRTKTNILNPFIRCVDNPPEIKKYQISLILDESKLGENGLNTNITDNNLSYYVSDNHIVLTENDILYDDDFDSINEIYLTQKNSLYQIDILLPEMDHCKISSNQINSKFDYNSMYDLQCNDISENINGSINEFYSYGEKNCSKLYASGNYNLSIICLEDIPTKQNINSEPFRLNFYSNNVLQIASVFPDNKEITDYSVDIGLVVSRDIVDNGINCGYAIDGNDELLQLINNGDYQFKKRLYGLSQGKHDVIFACNDKYGSVVYRKIEFDMI